MGQPHKSSFIDNHYNKSTVGNIIKESYRDIPITAVSVISISELKKELANWSKTVAFVSYYLKSWNQVRNLLTVLFLYEFVNRDIRKDHDR